jgi:hypothetical protein
MPVYFIRDPSNDSIKIGRSATPQKRIGQLQTGNPHPLELMGWIETEDDVLAEQGLHRFYKAYRGIGEWFAIDQDDVLDQLKRFSGFVPVSGESFAIFGYDRDGIPEYVGVCKWGDFEYDECCPFCGCFCGMHYQESTYMYHCLNCDAYTDFSELNRSLDSEDDAGDPDGV